MPQKGQLAYINPKILKWAREESGLTLKEASSSVLNQRKLENAEQGLDKLTFRQLILIAKKYRRPPGFFYLKNLPVEKELLNDFRTLDSVKVKYRPRLREQILKIKEKREFAVNFKTYSKKYDYSWINHISIKEKPEIIAKKILNLFNIKMEHRKKWKTPYDALNAWRNVVEKMGVLVFQISGILVTEMRGFSISEIPFPTIALNRGDAPLGRVFTLIHEFCHIMLKKGGICTIFEGDSDHFKVEKFCNAVTGAVLVPNDILIKSGIVLKHKTGEIWLPDELNSLKKYFWVSQEVILRRLLINNLTSNDFYQEKRNEWAKLIRKKAGGPEKPYTKVLKTNSHNFIKIVLNAMYNNKINLVDVSYYFDMSLKHLKSLEKNLEG